MISEQRTYDYSQRAGPWLAEVSRRDSLSKPVMTSCTVKTSNLIHGNGIKE